MRRRPCNLYLQCHLNKASGCYIYIYIYMYMCIYIDICMYISLSLSLALPRRFGSSPQAITVSDAELTPLDPVGVGPPFKGLAEGP